MNSFRLFQLVKKFLFYTRLLSFLPSVALMQLKKVLKRTQKH